VGKEEEEGGEGEDDAGCDRLAGGPDGLDDVVLEMVEPPRRFRTEMASTAMGIEALTVSPARRPR
jgi:hypothetical protein